MSPVTTPSSPIHREQKLVGQTVVVFGDGAGIGFETARRAHAEGAKVIFAGRNVEHLQHAASEVDALITAAFDAMDPVALERFFRDLPTIDHVMVTAGRPYYGRLADMDLAKIRDVIGEHLLRALYVARNAANRVRSGETLIFIGGTGGRRPSDRHGIAGAVAAALRALAANLALEITPLRVNVIAAGFLHDFVRGTAGRSTRKPSQPALHRASHQMRGRICGRSRARPTHYEQHRPYGRNL